MGKRNFTQLRKSMDQERFASFCKKIATEYAKSEAKFARTYFTNAYNITGSCYDKVMEYAVVENLVEEVIVIKMMNKAIANQKLHGSNDGTTTRAKYARMYAKRCENIAKTFEKEEIKNIATDFAKSPSMTKRDFAASCGISRKVLELLLERAITENIVEDTVVDAIETRSLMRNSGEDTKVYFASLRTKREINKKESTL